MSNQILFRPGTSDENTWKSVVDHDEYGLALLDPPLGTEDVVLDIGAHIGAFAYACLQRGAGLVVGVEPDTDNVNYARHNLHTACRAEARSVLITCAAWRSDMLSAVLRYAPVGVNTGGGNTLGDDGHQVFGAPFDRLVEMASNLSPSGRLRLLKIDCEAAEWPILLTSHRLHRVNAIVGEYHVIQDVSRFPAAAVDNHRVYDALTLAATLERAGFDHEITPAQNGLGLFRASRPPSAASLARVQ